MSFPSSAFRLGALAGLGLFLVAGTPAFAYEGHGVQESKADAQGYTIKADNQDDGSILVTYELQGEPEVSTVFKQGKLYSYFNISGLLPQGEKGMPEILYRQANLLVDANTEYGVEIVESDFREFKLRHPYLPSRGVITRSEDPNKVPYTIREDVRGAYPENIVEGAEAFFIRNVSGYNFRFAANQVDQAAREAKVYTKLVFKLVPQGQRAEVTEMTRESRQIEPEMAGAVQAMFLNAETTRWNYELADKGQLLVIYTSRDAAAIKPYIAHKKAAGFTVVEKQVNTGTNVVSVIKDAYNANKSILYVQLVGDFADLKVGTTITTANGKNETAAIDNAAGLVSGNDNYFDLIIGRFSANSAAEVTAQVNKSIKYEKTGPSASWRKKALALASNEGAGQGDDGEGDIQHETIIKDKKLIAKGGFSQVYTAFDSPSTAPLSAFMNPVNNGIGLINYTGHGIHYGWATSGFGSSNVNSMTNGDMTPVMISVACVVGQYNNSNQTCVAENVVRKASGGFVAGMMSTIYQPWLPPMKVQDYMNDLWVGGFSYNGSNGEGTSTPNGKNTLGSIAFNSFNLALAEGANTSTVQCYQSWILFGDCTLNVKQAVSGNGTIPDTDPTDPTDPQPTGMSIISQPKNVSVATGGTASFSVQVSGGAAPYKYQWYKNTSSISGATSASYSYKPTSSDNNATFYVVVKDANYKSVTSEKATLKVGSTQPQPQPTGGELIVNGTFEAGTNGWLSEDVSKVVGNWADQKPYAGSAYAWLLGYGKTTKQYLYQGVTIPSNVASANLTFQLRVNTAETTKSTKYDTMNLYVVNGQGSILATLATYSNLDASASFVRRSFDMSKYKGQNVYLYFQGQEDNTAQTSFVIDNVSLIAR